MGWDCVGLEQSFVNNGVSEIVCWGCLLCAGVENRKRDRTQKLPAVSAVLVYVHCLLEGERLQAQVASRCCFEGSSWRLQPSKACS